MERKEEIGKILDRTLAEDLSTEELNELYTMLNKEDDEDFLKFLLYSKWMKASSGRKAELCRIFEGVMDKTGIKSEDINSDASVLKEMLRPPVTLKSRMLTTMRYAAIIAFAVITTILVYKREEKSWLLADKNLNSVTAPYGSRTYMELSDGTKIWLNSGSKLIYPGKFGIESRSVSIEGEAFFEVAKDPEKPFIVQTSDLDVVVLGTSFNLKNYPDEKNIETTVIEGQVKVITKKFSPVLTEEIVLKSKEKAVYDKENTKMRIDKIVEYAEADKSLDKIPAKEAVVATEEVITAWKNDHLVFHRESLYEMARKLERWYGMIIVIDKRIPVNETYSGKFMNNETIYQVLEAISIITPLQTEVKGTTIYIRPGKK